MNDLIQYYRLNNVVLWPITVIDKDVSNCIEIETDYGIHRRRTRGGRWGLGPPAPDIRGGRWGPGPPAPDIRGGLVGPKAPGPFFHGFYNL